MRGFDFGKLGPIVFGLMYIDIVKAKSKLTPIIINPKENKKSTTFFGIFME